jgi:hypothetical protein
MFLYFSAAALIENGHNLTDIIKLLTDRQYRSTLQFSDPVTKAFWAGFDDLKPSQQRLEVSSTLNKFYTLLADPRLRRMLGTNRKGLRLSDFLQDQVLHVRLPVRQYGKGKVKLVGSLVISYLTQLLLERNDPRPYDLYIDDAHLFAHDTVQNALLSTSRYGLSTTLAHQHSNQLHPDLFNALMGNTEIQYIFRVSQDDAAILSPKMPPMSSKSELDRLRNYSYRTLPFNKYDPDGVTLPVENLYEGFNCTGHEVKRSRF